MVNKKIIFLLSIIFIISSVNAQLNIMHKVDVINDVAGAGEKLEYNVTIINKGEESVMLTLNILFPGITEIVPSVFTLKPGEEKVVYVGLTVSQTQRPGKILINLFVFDSKGNSLQPPILLKGEIVEFAEMFKDIKINYVKTIPEKIDPRKEFSIEAEISNPVKEVRVPLEITSEIKGFEYKTNMIILNGTNVIKIHDLKIPNTTLPGNYSFTLNLLFSKDVIVKSSFTLEVAGYGLCDIKEYKNITLIQKSYLAKVKNIGTEETTCSISSKVPRIEKILIRKISEGYKYEENKLKWEITLKPGEEAFIRYEVSYIPMLMIPFAILFICGGLWYLTRKIYVKKELIGYKRYPGFMDLNIQIRIKGLSKELKNLKIYEPIPPFIKEIKGYGTVVGKVVKKGKKRFVYWEIEKLKQNEERVFSYKARTSIEVLGKILFKPTKVSFKDEKGRKIEETSNVLAIEVE